MNFERSAVWWKAFRFHYTSASFMPGILGGMIAWNTEGRFHPEYFLLVMLGLILNHMALNMTDDYYDFRHLIDVFASEEKNPYAGGSGTLSTGLILLRRCVSVYHFLCHRHWHWYFSGNGERPFYSFLFGLWVFLRLFLYRPSYSIWLPGSR